VPSDIAYRLSPAARTALIEMAQVWERLAKEQGDKKE
jgi:hypothetical protein